MSKQALAAVLALTAASLSAQALARDSINIVGSSTVFPFSTAVAENFGRGGFKTPKVESTGTGGGIKLFCAGSGVDTPDIANASRAMKASEFEVCVGNGVKEITEVRIGFDGIVLAESKAGQGLDLSLKDIFLALAKDVPNDKGDLVPNPNKTWKDVNPALPDTKIEVLGPPPTSGTRDAFAELAMDGGCNSFPALKALKKSDEKKHQAVCQAIREDGAYIEAGENDNLIVQKLVANPKAVGVFGYSFLEQNEDKVRGSKVGGVAPTYDSISSAAYPISRSLYFYVKNGHVDAIPGIKQYVAEFTSDKAWGPDGYLADKGLIALPDADRKAMAASAKALTPMAKPAH
ncbi:substrate-binding domain-containing protein [Candidatus Thiodictyon syntrophicum]|jgi:phosphate transport system substrate-binding protein|uniref:Phosphate ABC transporter substrate-binding protein n=1 Tax=Candidatus Thiodictyon syntrophicum TaxID=1166950 RepID=A0A2K8U645_9GAMM|nr:substrate-binding domain-containing protein [Candidatus Thiodictyon syntrophicum]AUB80501.1 phosphate ABC transporter substrate-binding protein [Candidatus Thiodictyon syntrophicum]